MATDISDTITQIDSEIKTNNEEKPGNIVINVDESDKDDKNEEFKTKTKEDKTTKENDIKTENEKLETEEKRKAEENYLKIEQNESKTEQNESKTEQNEIKTPHNDTKPEQNQTKTDKNDSKPENGLAKLQISEFLTIQLPTRTRMSFMEEESAKEKLRLALLKQCSAILKQGDQKYTKESLHKTFQDVVSFY